MVRSGLCLDQHSRVGGHHGLLPTISGRLTKPGPRVPYRGCRRSFAGHVILFLPTADHIATLQELACLSVRALVCCSWTRLPQVVLEFAACPTHSNFYSADRNL